MRVVLDTNLFVSYLLTQGETISQIIDYWEQKEFVVLVSPEILSELRDVVRRPRLQPYMTADPHVLLELLDKDAELVSGRVVLQGLCRDPKDDKFIACAAEGSADFIITGDSDLLDMVQVEQIEIIRPYDFLSVLKKE